MQSLPVSGSPAALPNETVVDGAHPLSDQVFDIIPPSPPPLSFRSCLHPYLPPSFLFHYAPSTRDVGNSAKIMEPAATANVSRWMLPFVQRVPVCCCQAKLSGIRMYWNRKRTCPALIAFIT